MSINTEYRYKDIEEYRGVLNKAPIDSLVQSRSLGGNKTVKYVPIEVQEAMADCIFREWNIIEENYIQICNEILCTIKIQFLPDYPGADFQFCTGTGAKPIQQDKNSIPSKFPEGKKTNAIEYNAPNARSTAIGNALETLGNCFGRNLNRKVDAGFHISPKKKETEK